MSAIVHTLPAVSSGSDSVPVSPAVSGWTVHEFLSVPSTNLIAANLPPWHAVRADIQTAGRGRFERAWTSDLGGLWLSGVVPTPSPASAADPRVLPLVAGLTICEVFRKFALEPLRMRWPNDILLSDRKLAGLLLDQFVPHLIIIGIGINLHNHPEVRNPALKNLTARLADWLPTAPSPAELMPFILQQLRRTLDELEADGFGQLLARINQLWGKPHQVELDLDGEFRRGIFTQIDPTGRLLLADERGCTTAYHPSQVRHLREL